VVIPALLLSAALFVPPADSGPKPAATPTKAAPCPAQGDATKPEIRELNERKARNDTPSDDDVDETVTIDALVEPGDDSLRWQDGVAIEIVAYVLEIRDGGAGVRAYRGRPAPGSRRPAPAAGKGSRPSGPLERRGEPLRRPR